MGLDPSRLGPGQRRRDLDRLVDEAFDIVVVGGGVTGTGIALDAVLRGLSVALVEQRDYASGSSSRSSKLLHGGLRYLERLEFGLVREALRERNLTLEVLAPHLARKVSFLYPLTHHGWERLYVGAGVALYDLLATGSRSVLPRHRHLTQKEALLLAPDLRGGFLGGALQYWDAQIDDARHTMTIARTAAAHGAALVPSARVIGFSKTTDRLTGVDLFDNESGRSFTVRARQVINAAGPWADRIQRLASPQQPRVRPSKGVHLVVPSDRIQSESAIISRVADSVILLVPWNRHWIIGTTDTVWDFDQGEATATFHDIDYLLRHANGLLRHPISRSDVVGVYAGVRPLLAGAKATTARLSREHSVSTTSPGLITVVGGKYTTYRVMAEEAVTLAMKEMGFEAAPSVTSTTPLIGADGYEALLGKSRSMTHRGMDHERLARLLGRYGDRLPELLDRVDSRPDLATPIEGADDYLGVEVEYAVSHEGALHLEDVLARRTRIAIETPHRGVAVARTVATIMAPLLGWSREKLQSEISCYTDRVRTEISAQSDRDDRPVGTS